jgi:tRNA nucleotidyltransferase (CCA-adding enzyme)
LNVEHKLNEIIDKKECFSQRNLAVNGKDLMRLGIGGREVGNMLKLLLDAVIDDPGLNSKDKLLEIAAEAINTGK